jgi:predicted acyl esterase
MLGKFLQLLLAIAPLALAETFFIPMRDGTKLHTDIDFPPFFPAGKRAPVVFERSPYGENKEELIALVMAELLSYIGVRQDVRGTGQSEGRFGVWHDSVNDSYDTLDWISNQTWSNGQVFVTGVSADAIDAVCTMSAPHPSVRAQVIIFATSQAWETFYVGGAYREALIDGWLTSTVRSQAPALIPMVHSHEALSDPWWDTVNGTLWFNNVAWPSIHWAGWYDIFQSGHLAAFRGYNELSALPGQAKLVIDPCGHCQAAAAYFPENAVLGRAALPLLMALDLLADDSVTNRSWPAPAEGVKNVTFYVMGDDEGGAPGNYWTTLERFPEPTPYTLYFHLGGTLEAAAPSAPSDAVAYSYNPADPVPTVGGDNLEIPCGPLDQRVIERAGRQDVLVFTSDVLTEPLAITGGPLADIFMSSTALDTDMTVKLIDVYPARDSDPLFDGASILVLGECPRPLVVAPQPLVLLPAPSLTPPARPPLFFALQTASRA